jgi:transcriptional regulator with XRE-family HTH domain
MSAPGQSKDRIVSKKPNDMDVYIGGRLRLWRRTMDVDASYLAEKIGITYQQLQKYEKGVNRISATRLYAVSRELNVPIDYFYQDATPHRNAAGESPESDQPSGVRFDMLANGVGADIVKCYLSIKDSSVRKAMIALMRSVVSKQDEDSELAFHATQVAGGAPSANRQMLKVLPSATS